jgi:hypothetical protein
MKGPHLPHRLARAGCQLIPLNTARWVDAAMHPAPLGPLRQQLICVQRRSLGIFRLPRRREAAQQRRKISVHVRCECLPVDDLSLTQMRRHQRQMEQGIPRSQQRHGHIGGRVAAELMQQLLCAPVCQCRPPPRRGPQTRLDDHRMAVAVTSRTVGQGYDIAMPTDGTTRPWHLQVTRQANLPTPVPGRPARDDVGRRRMSSEMGFVRGLPRSESRPASPGPRFIRPAPIPDPQPPLYPVAEIYAATACVCPAPPRSRGPVGSSFTRRNGRCPVNCWWTHLRAGLSPISVDHVRAAVGLYRYVAQALRSTQHIAITAKMCAQCMA